MQGSELQAHLRTEIEQVMPIISQLTGLAAHWSGSVELVEGAEFKGKKRFNCTIEINAALAEQDLRWPTLIHEILHAHSVGYNGTDYRNFRGWEEGVVEQLQRLLRPQILARLGVSISETVFHQSAIHHRYNRYINALETLREPLYPFANQQAAFYIALLGTPISERIAFVLERGYRLPFAERVKFVRDFSAANDVLTRRTL